MKSLVFVFLITFGNVLFSEAQGQSTVRSVCEGDAKKINDIKTCEKEMRSEMCSDIPKGQQVDCYNPEKSFNPILREVKSRYNCSMGGATGIIDSVKGVYELGSRAVSSTFNSTEYSLRVNDEAKKACEQNKEVLKARELYDVIVRTSGVSKAVEIQLARVQKTTQECMNNEISKGKWLGISFELPKTDDIKSVFVCLNEDAQQQLACKVVAPMVAGGAAGAAIKAAARKALTRAGVGPAGEIRKALDDYVAERKAEGKLSEVELYNLAHQTDLINAINNPKVAARIKAAGIDLKGLVNGILDSDYGKMEAGRKLLTTNSPASELGFNILKGEDKVSPAARAYQKHLDEVGQSGKTDFPSGEGYTNEAIRKIFAEKGILTGRNHEFPGMIDAFKKYDDLMKPTRMPPLSEAQKAKFERELIDRLNANRGHNHSPTNLQANPVLSASGKPITPFWDDMEEKIIPMVLRGNPVEPVNPLHANFFRGTMHDSGKVVNGIVVPKYPAPTHKAVFVHSIFDRLSQATGGGNMKIFSEVGGKTLADSPKIPIGELPDLSNFGKKNGLNNLADLVTGRTIKNADGSLKETFSSARMTDIQFRGLTEAIERSKYSPIEKAPMKELAQAGRDRTLAYDDFVKSRVDYTKDANGNVLTMSLKDTDGGHIGTINLSTPSDEAMKIFGKFKAAEERFNGDPFRDLMNPRVLTKSEMAAYGLAVSGSYYYCNKQRVGGSTFAPPTPQNSTPRGITN